MIQTAFLGTLLAVAFHFFLLMLIQPASSPGRAKSGRGEKTKGDTSLPPRRSPSIKQLVREDLLDPDAGGARAKESKRPLSSHNPSRVGNALLDDTPKGSTLAQELSKLFDVLEGEPKKRYASYARAQCVRCSSCARRVPVGLRYVRGAQTGSPAGQSVPIHQP